MKVAVYPGSFDPITLGHLDIIRRAAAVFDKVIVCVMINFEKQPMFTQAERLALIRRTVSDLPNVVVDSSDKLLAEYAREKGACAIIKGLRAMSDFEKEFQMALVNKKINPALETFFLASSEQYTYLSSTMVKEMAKYGVDLSGFVPGEIIADIISKS